MPHEPTAKRARAVLNTVYRGTVLLGVVCVCSGGLAACGTSASDPVAVHIGQTAISRAEVSHWTSLIAAESSKGPMPDPPKYSACIANLRAAPATTAQSKPTHSALKRTCEVNLQKFELKALYFLIPYEWVSSEASELGVKLPGEAPKQQLARMEHSLPDARGYLVGPRGTTADALMRIKLALLTRQIQQSLEMHSRQQQLTPSERQQALNKFGERFRATWSARTSCRPGYFVTLCRNYKAPGVAPTLGPPSVPLTNMSAE